MSEEEGLPKPPTSRKRKARLMSEWEWKIVKSTIKFRAIHLFIILAASAILSSFDTSAEILLAGVERGQWQKRVSRALLRWDVFHFLNRATHAHATWEYEHEIAFMPGVPLLMRLGGTLLGNIRGVSRFCYVDALLGGTILANCFSILTPLELYRLTRVTYPNLTKSQAATPALIMAACTPSPPSMLVPYTEAVYSPLSLMAARLVREGKWYRAAAVALAAASTRANGFLLGGFFVYDILFLPVLHNKSIPKNLIYVGRLPLYHTPLTTSQRIMTASFGVVASFAPFAYTQVEAYTRLCPHKPFCSNALPLAYSYVQAKYWNNGLFSYWTVQQIPNFVISLPIYIVAIAALRDAPVTLLSLPHYILHALVVALLLFVSNVQIALRFATALPALWWWVAARRESRLAKCFIVWAQIWGCVSCVLWAAFLPPA